MHQLDSPGGAVHAIRDALDDHDLADDDLDDDDLDHADDDRVAILPTTPMM